MLAHLRVKLWPAVQNTTLLVGRNLCDPVRDPRPHVLRFEHRIESVDVSLQVDAGDLVSSTQVINIGPNATATIDGGEGGKFFVDDEQVCGDLRPLSGKASHFSVTFFSIDAVM